MSLLFKYVLRENGKVLAWIFLVLSTLCFLIDFFERWDDLLEHGVSTSKGIYFMACRMPQYVIYVIPVSMLLSSFITLGLMGRRNELIALKASGASGLLIVRPMLLTALVLCGISFFWAESLVPAANREAARIWQMEVKRTSQRSLVTSSETWLRIPSAQGVTLYRIGFLKMPQSPLPGPSRGSPLVLNDVSVLRLDRDFRLLERIDAREMSWEEEHWELSEGLHWVSRELEPQGPKVERFEKKSVPLAERPEDFQWVRQAVESMGFFELLAYVERARREGFDAAAQLTDLHFKVASAFFSLVTALFTIPLAMRIPPRTGGLAFGVTLSMAIGFLYYLLLAMGLALGRGGVLSPFLGAWGPNVLFGSVGIWWTLHMRQ